MKQNTDLFASVKDGSKKNNMMDFIRNDRKDKSYGVGKSLHTVRVIELLKKNHDRKITRGKWNICFVKQMGDSRYCKKKRAIAVIQAGTGERLDS